MKILTVILGIVLAMSASAWEPANKYDPNCDAVCKMHRQAAEDRQQRDQRELEYLRREAEQARKAAYDAERERERQETIAAKEKRSSCDETWNKCD